MKAQKPVFAVIERRWLDDYDRATRMAGEEPCVASKFPRFVRLRHTQQLSWPDRECRTAVMESESWAKWRRKDRIGVFIRDWHGSRTLRQATGGLGF